MQNADDIIPFRRSEALYPDVLYGGHEYPGYSGSAWMFRKHGKVKAELRQEEPESQRDGAAEKRICDI